MQYERRIKQILEQDIKISRLPLLNKCNCDQEEQSQLRRNLNSRTFILERGDRKTKTLFHPRTLKREGSLTYNLKMGQNDVKQQQKKFYQASRSSEVQKQTTAPLQKHLLKNPLPASPRLPQSTNSTQGDQIKHLPTLSQPNQKLSAQVTQTKMNKISRIRVRKDSMRSIDYIQNKYNKKNQGQVKKNRMGKVQIEKEKEKESKERFRENQSEISIQFKKSKRMTTVLRDQVQQNQSKFVKRKGSKANTLKLNVNNELKHRRTHIIRRLDQTPLSKVQSTQKIVQKIAKPKIRRNIRAEANKRNQGQQKALDMDQNFDQQKRLNWENRRARNQGFSKSLDNYKDYNQINLQRMDSISHDPLQIKDCLPSNYDFTIEQPQKGTYFGDIMIPFQLCKHSQFTQDQEDQQEKQMSYFLRIQ